MCHGIEACQTEAALEEAQEPGDPVGPASSVDEGGEDVFARGIVGRCGCEDRDGDDEEAAETPGKGEGVEMRENAIAQGVDEKDEGGDGEVDEELVPSVVFVGR